MAALVRFIASHFDVLAAERASPSRWTPAPCVAAVDPEKLQRVVMNLLSNAFKFAPAGGRVRCRLQTRGTAALLSVEDSGPGVRPELRQAVFERFRQGDGGANRQVSRNGPGPGDRPRVRRDAQGLDRGARLRARAGRASR